ncbi:hypothetical protein VTJ83DRAFT_5724 [Remersonia thermophila]|uniref:DUF3955 domain-containing protein n=1 Tax=Remersonia thermophila TaxID=72144 RepID=A0ABR4D9W1_9PEZI
MAPVEPMLPGELAPDHTTHHAHGHARRQSTTSYTHPSAAASAAAAASSSSSSRRRSQSVTASAMLAAPPDSEPSLSRTPSAALTSESRISGAASSSRGSQNLREQLGLGGVARRTLGIVLLLIVVFLWTLSNFLASEIFSDGTYNKPFFLVYINTATFAISLIPLTIRYVYRHGLGAAVAPALRIWREKRFGMVPLRTRDDEAGSARELFGADDSDSDDDDDDNEGRGGRRRSRSGSAAARLLVDDEGSFEGLDKQDADDKLSLAETARLSAEFSLLWFSANYFASACLEYTSVGSVTILTSTSSIWTLIFGALCGVEGFTLRKLLGVLASLAGVVLISSVDLSGANDDNRGSFPHKTTTQIAIGDSMAFFSAIIYGIYVTVMKRRVGNEERVNMPLFFGLVGLFNVLFLWPGFLILHWTGIEPFQLPPTGVVWTIIVTNSASSFFSDILWAYAMLLTTPLIVTVGLSLTIPLSLIGEMIRYSQYSSWLYWMGAGIVFLSFLFVSNESHDEGGGESKDREGERTSSAV